MKGLGRKHAPDARDLQHLMASKLPVTVTRPTHKTWRLWWHGDQGDTPMCVGYGWHGLLRALPHLQTDPKPAVLYHEAQLNDEFPGENYDGSSVRGGAKALRKDGKITAYAWAFDVQTVVNWLATHGPVVMGTDWYDSMFTPDATGLVVPSGALAGGHCYVAIGYDDAKHILICQNSWGMDWGLNGRFHLHYEDADALIKANGEACTPTE